MYRDICDSSVCTDNPDIMLDSSTINLVAYFDENELCNPLGIASKKKKLGCIFFTLVNMHPALRSTLKAVADVPTNLLLILRSLALLYQISC